jgi:hypothetical protein
MDSLREIGYRIKEQLDAGYPSDDSRIDIELVYAEVNVARAKIIAEEIKAKRSLGDVDGRYYQKKRCIEITCTPILCDGRTTGYEHIANIPSIISAAPNGGIQYLGLNNWSKRFTERNPATHMYTNEKVFGKPSPYYLRINNEVTLYNLPTPNMKYIGVIGVFDKPCDEECSVDDPYPFPPENYLSLEILVKKHFGADILAQRPDKIQNTNPDL